MENIKLVRAYHVAILDKDTKQPTSVVGDAARVIEAENLDDALTKGRQDFENLKKSHAPILELLSVLDPKSTLNNTDVFVVGVAIGFNGKPEDEAAALQLAQEELERDKPFIIANSLPGARFEESTRDLTTNGFTVAEVDKAGVVLRQGTRSKLRFAGRELEEPEEEVGS